MAKDILGSGNPNADIMFVGEAPGKEEEREGKVFVGAAGRELKGSSLSEGIDVESCWFTNICLRRPPENRLVRFFTDSGLPGPEVTDGLANLSEEVERINPSVIVALGNYPLWALTRLAKWNSKKDSDTGERIGYTGISNWRGSIVPATAAYRERKVVATYHPAAILRSHADKPYFRLDLRRVKEQSSFREIRPPKCEIYVDPRGELRDKLVGLLLASPDPISFDIEFVGFKLLCVSFCAYDDWVMSVRVRGPEDLNLIKMILQSGRELVAQNAMYDQSVLEWHYGIESISRIVYDTMLASHSAYIELPKDLGTLCSIYTEMPAYWTEINADFWKRFAMGAGSAKDWNDLQVYNAKDSWVTHHARKQQIKDEFDDSAVKKTFNFEMSLLSPLWEASKLGVPVDKKRLEELRIQTEIEIYEKSHQLKQLAGSEINVKSPKQVADLLFGVLKLPVLKRNKTGPATDDYTLSALAEQIKGRKDQMGVIWNAAVNLIRQIRKGRDLISKFCDIECDTDGRMRFHFNIGGTGTGRLSSNKFAPTGKGTNGQNIPRPKKVRSVFIPDPGHEFFYNDLERAESLLVSHLTNDPLMLEHHGPGVNAHKKLASLLFGLEEDAIDKEGPEYYMGKQTRHAGNYMEGWLTFMKNVNLKANVTGISIDAAEAKRLIGLYREIYPGLPAWWRDIEHTLRTSGGRLYTMLGRPRTFYDRLDSVLPRAIAYIPQGTVGDTLNIGLQRIANDPECKELGVKIFMQVHDAIGGQYPTSNRDAAMKRMEELMRVELVNPHTRQPFYIPVELACGPSWGEVKAYHL